MAAQGWPADYGGVMLQGFYWDSFSQSAWTKLEKQADNFAGYFDLIWVPQSGRCLNPMSMGYDPYYFFDQNSSFGTAAELKSMIATFKANGIGTIADVVINHHNTTGWWTFPSETYKGKTYRLRPSDITANDDGHAASAQAAKDGVRLSTNNDEGEDWAGMRDLDHQSPNVQQLVKAYGKMLVDDIGYAGFRYDMVKGFGASHVGDYNDAAGVKFSVGEYWDSNPAIQNWINATGKRSAAFDFRFRYNVRDAINKNDWRQLNSTNNLIHDEAYRRYAVTFVENHDTELRSASEQQDPIRRDTLAANAFLLAMPGTPCVFYKHYMAYPTELKAMIDVRKATGITNTSTYANYRSANTYFANTVMGNKGSLLVAVGKNFPEPAANRYVKVLSGHHYAYYLSPSTEVAFADKPSGTYDAPFTTTLTAVSASNDAQLVYTTDGTNPSATNGTRISRPTSIQISSDCTLKAALLSGGKTRSMTTRVYKMAAPETFETPPAGYKYTAYFVSPTTWSRDAEIHAWAWIKDGANYTPDDSAQWPGDKEHVYCIGKHRNGGYIWQWCYYGLEGTPPQFIIFNNGNSGVGTNQTKDMVFAHNGWYDMQTERPDPNLGIKTMPRTTDADHAWYTLMGTRVNAPTQKGIYIHHGKKIIAVR